MRIIQALSIFCIALTTALRSRRSAPFYCARTAPAPRVEKSAIDYYRLSWYDCRPS